MCMNCYHDLHHSLTILANDNIITNVISTIGGIQRPFLLVFHKTEGIEEVKTYVSKQRQNMARTISKYNIEGPEVGS